MHPADIKALLAKAGCTQSSIAREVVGRSGRAVSVVAVSHVITGRSRSRVIAKAIAAAVGRSVGSLWPGKYPELEAERALAKAVPSARKGRGAGAPMSGVTR